MDEPGTRCLRVPLNYSDGVDLCSRIDAKLWSLPAQDRLGSLALTAFLVCCFSCCWDDLTPKDLTEKYGHTDLEFLMLNFS